jgi:hypothetical protein
MTHDGAIFVDLPQKVEEVRPTRYIGLRRLGQFKKNYVCNHGNSNAQNKSTTNLQQ